MSVSNTVFDTHMLAVLSCSVMFSINWRPISFWIQDAKRSNIYRKHGQVTLMHGRAVGGGAALKLELHQ